MNKELNRMRNHYIREVEESVKLIGFFLSILKIYMVSGGLVLVASIIINIFYQFHALNVLWSILYIMLILISGAVLIIIFNRVIKRKQLLIEILLNENTGE